MKRQRAESLEGTGSGFGEVDDRDGDVGMVSRKGDRHVTGVAADVEKVPNASEHRAARHTLTVSFGVGRHGPAKTLAAGVIATEGAVEARRRLATE